MVLGNDLNNAIVSGKTWSDFVTVSDEAFVLVNLENNWNVWTPKDYHIINNKEYYKTVKSKKSGIADTLVMKDGVIVQKPRWSTKGKGGNWVKFCGWSHLGIKCFEELKR